MTFITTPVAHTLTSDFVSDAIQVDGNHCTIAVTFDGIQTSDVTAELDQSVDGVNWGLIAESPITLEPGQTSHQWNVLGIVACAFLRVRIGHGTSTSGTITNFKVLTSKY